MVEGEAEEIIPQLAADLERGEARPHYLKAASFPIVTRVPLPDLHLTDLRRYSSMAVQYSRGCPFTCEFCDIIEIYGRRPRTKTPEQALRRVRAALRHSAGADPSSWWTTTSSATRRT